MPEKPRQLELPEACTIYIGGQPCVLTNLRMTKISGNSFVEYTKPDDTRKSMQLIPPFDTSAELVIEGIAWGLSGHTEKAWNNLSDERKLSNHTREQVRRGVTGGDEDGLSVFRG